MGGTDIHGNEAMLTANDARPHLTFADVAQAYVDAFASSIVQFRRVRKMPNQRRAAKLCAARLKKSAAARGRNDSCA